jgi:hypothetical protein
LPAGELAITEKNDRFPNSIEALKIFRDTKLAQKMTSYPVKIKQFFVLEAPHNLKVTGSNPVPATRQDPADQALSLVCRVFSWRDGRHESTYNFRRVRPRRFDRPSKKSLISP